MNYEEMFSSIWNSIEGLEIPEPADHTICIYAISFQRWIEELSKMMENPTAVGVNQAKILLTDKYFEWDLRVPQSHRMHLGIHGHTCIYQIFKKSYTQLLIMELTLTPPQINFPPPVIPTPKQMIGGLFIAEGSDDDQQSS